MATLDFNPGMADSGGGNFVAFPQPLMSWRTPQSMKGRTHEIPDGDDVRTGHAKGPFRISIRGIIAEATPTANIDKFNEIAAKAMSAKNLWLIRHRTAGGTNQEYYKDVHCVSIDPTRTNKPLTVLPWRAEFVAKDPDVYTASPLS